MLWKLLLVLASAAIPVAGQASCHILGLTGTYVLYNEGVLITTPQGASTPVAAPFAEIGMVTIDTSGSVTGWLTMANPNIFNFEFVGGSVSVQSNCTGVMTTRLRIKGTNTILPSTVKIPFTVKNAEPMEIHSVVSQGPMGPQTPVINLATWIRVSPLTTPPYNCSLSQLGGTYVVDGKATIYMTNEDKSVTPVPATWTMVGTLDSQGKLSGQGPMDFPMQLPPLVLGANSIEIKPDCTGTYKFKFTNPATGTELPGQAIVKLVVIQAGDQLTVKGLYTQGILGTPVALETWTRVSQQVQ